MHDGDGMKPGVDVAKLAALKDLWIRFMECVPRGGHFLQRHMYSAHFKNAALEKYAASIQKLTLEL